MINLLAIVVVVVVMGWIHSFSDSSKSAHVAKVSGKRDTASQSGSQNTVHQPKYVRNSKSEMPANLPDTADRTFASVASWRQDFSTNSSLAKWNFEEGNNNGWGNNELQTYTKNNVSVQNGVLTITAKKSGSSYTSGRITTENKFDFKYGKLDIVAALPTGKGIWPALWLLPSDAKYDENGNWLSNGEIDMIEGSALGDSEFSGSAHSLNHAPGNNMRTGTVRVGSPASTFHTYSLEWTPQSLNFLVDGKAFYHVTNSGAGFKDWPYDQRFHLVMNIAVGGSQSTNGVDGGAFPAQLKVRSISYYPYGGQ